MKKYIPLLAILLIALAARLYNLRAPLVGIRGWRQADTMAMAINYHENGYNLFYPQIDWGGNTPGYVEAEFPIYSYAAALLFNLFGVSELSARLLSIALSLIGVCYFYLLIKEQVNEQTALWSCLFISILPLNVFMGRTIMPESLLLTSLIIGVYYFAQWLNHNKWWHLGISAIFISTACLVKIPSLYVGLPLLFLAWLKFEKKVFLQWKLWLFAITIFVTVGAWYYHSHQIYLQYGLTFGIWEYGTDKWGNWGLIATWEYWRQIWVEHLGKMFFVWFAYPIFIFGLFQKRITENEKVFDYWLAGIIIYFIIVGRGNFVHDYYQLPFTIPAAVYLGKVYAKYFNKNNIYAYLALAATLIGIFISSAYYYTTVYAQSEDPRKSAKYELAQLITKDTNKDALIIVIDNNDPTALYLSNRKGWRGSIQDILNESLLNERIENGAQYLAGICPDKTQCNRIQNILNKYDIIFEKKEYFIVKLKN